MAVVAGDGGLEFAFEGPAGPVVEHGGEGGVVGGIGTHARAVGDVVGAAAAVVVDAEGGVADAAVGHDGEEHAAVLVAAADFGDEEGIVGAGEEVEDFELSAVVGEVDIGGDEVEGGGGQWPDGDDVVGGAAAFVAAGPGIGEGVAEGGVGVHGEGIDGLAGGGDLADVVGDIIGVEVFIGIIAEDGGPLALGVVGGVVFNSLRRSGLSISAGTGDSKIFWAVGE